MLSRSRVFWSPLLAFAVGSGLGLTAPIPSAVSHGIRHAVAQKNIFALVSRLAGENQAVLNNSRAIDRTLTQVQQKLLGLHRMVKTLGQQSALNGAVSHVLSRQVQLNVALVQSQTVLKSRESTTLQEQTQVAGASAQLLGLLNQSVSQLTELKQSTGSTVAELGSLNGLLAEVVTELLAVEKGTTIPVIHEPVTRIVPSLPETSTAPDSLQSGLTSLQKSVSSGLGATNPSSLPPLPSNSPLSPLTPLLNPLGVSR